MSVINELKVYATHPHPCSYLEDEEATTLFIDPAAELDARLSGQLADMGFRRSGPHIYRPHCVNCHACIPVRLPVADYQSSRQQRRCWNKNKDLHVETVNDISDSKFYTLYERYIRERHADGDMYPPSRDQYESFLCNARGGTEFHCFYHESRLMAVAVTDVMENGFSALYTFYEPPESKRSLGVYAILWQIEQLGYRQLPYLYLGYWIKACQKMSYKINYRPLELYINGKWLNLS